jgi:hypothetical protein
MFCNTIFAAWFRKPMRWGTGGQRRAGDNSVTNRKHKTERQVPLTPAPISITFFGVWGFDGDELSIRQSIRHPPKPPRTADDKRGEGTESSASTTTKAVLITCCPELRPWRPWRLGI